MLEDHYSLTKKLGDGEFGEVWEGVFLRKDEEYGGTRSSGEDRTVAIKIFKNTCKDAIIHNELEINKEVILLGKRFDSAYFVKVFNVNLLMKLSGRKTLVMECLTGGELFERIISRRTFSERDAAITIHALATALYCFHEQGIIHRDIKPENVVYRSADPNATPVIVDFGFGVKGTPDAVDPRTCIFHDKGAKMALGTPGYIAPESYSHHVYLNKSDIWSLGIIAYIILAGFPPFDNKDPLLKERTIRGKFYPLHTQPWDHISDAAKDFVLKLMCVDPNARYTAEQALQHPWILKYTSGTGAGPKMPSVADLAKQTSELDSKNLRGPAQQGIHNADDAEQHDGDKEFDADYVKRISRMATHRKLRKTFNGIVWTVRLRKACVESALLGRGHEGAPGRMDVSADIEDIEGKITEMPNVALVTGFGDEAMPPSSPIRSRNTSTVGTNRGAASPKGMSRANSSAESKQDTFTVTVQQLDLLHDKLVKENVRMHSGRAGSVDTSKQRSSSIFDSEKSAVNNTAPAASHDSAMHISRQSSVREADKSHVKTEGTLSAEIAAPYAFETFRKVGGVNFEEFCVAVKSVGMYALATKRIFEIFDMDRSGTVSPVEFISTLAQFQELPSVGISQEEKDNYTEKRTRMFFSLFDTDGNGTISRGELASVTGMLLNDRFLEHPSGIAQSQSASVTPSTTTMDEVADDRNIPDTFTALNDDYADLFDAIDTDKSGEISYSEFYLWFNKSEHASYFARFLDPIDAIKRNMKAYVNVSDRP